MGVEKGVPFPVYADGVVVGAGLAVAVLIGVSVGVGVVVGATVGVTAAVDAGVGVMVELCVAYPMLALPLFTLMDTGEAFTSLT